MDILLLPNSFSSSDLVVFSDSPGGFAKRSSEATWFGTELHHLNKSTRYVGRNDTFGPLFCGPLAFRCKFLAIGPLSIGSKVFERLCTL
jgi:hypothetical protein